nr:WD repeat-containing protein 44-like [Ipomoea trifida]GLL35634.1 WD repeat-containing protein 44-like [Ipomoea trifida]GLL35635.1 WD repeat-containing protein 44-like [Ipomoea trifida]GLL35636.1 WD repeat-containing protein 44-like [Ipomoea trifida]GLL35637.1 WD repeat-containing protein 44-like [Ipomoea trifida]
MVSNGPVLLNSMSKDEFSFSQSSALGSSKESGSHADFKFGSGNTDCEMNCNVRSLAEHFMSSNRPNVGFEQLLCLKTLRIIRVNPARLKNLFSLN